MGFVSGVKSTFDNNGSTTRLEIPDGLKYLSPKNDGISILKRLGMDGFTFSKHKYEWRETVLASRKELVTVLVGDTTWTVADAKQYQVNTLLRVESEIVKVTAIASATTLTVVRGVGGTTAAAHTSKYAITLGTAMPEGGAASDGLSDNGLPYYNYDQIFERGVSLTDHEIADLSVEGNPLPKQLERRTIELYREIASAFFYGVRFQDSTNEVYGVGGVKQFVTTNVTNVGGALTVAVIDAKILAVVQAGGDPKSIVVSPYQAQKLAALDLNYQQIGKREHTGGSLVIKTWQSTLLDHDLDIIIDHSILDDELYILDWDHIKIGHLEGNGKSGAVHIVDSTENGARQEDRVIRADVGFKFEVEKAQAYLYGLS